jgi:hypothetical protein
LGNASVSDLPAHRWPWQWTFAITLEERWDRIRELVQLDDDENGVPKEYWHDTDRVEKWVEDQKERRKAKYDTQQ